MRPQFATSAGRGATPGTPLSPDRNIFSQHLHAARHLRAPLAAEARRWRGSRARGSLAVLASAAAAFPQQPSDEAPARPVLSPDGIIDPDGTVLMQAPRDPEESKRLWTAAIKLPMYSVGIMPILVTATAAWLNTGALMPLRTLGLLVSAVAIIAWLNLSNDVFDSMTGVDSAQRKPESVVNLTGSRLRVFALAHALLLSGAGLLFYLLQSVVRDST